MEHAERLAEFSQNFQLLVQIKVENRRENFGALDIIDKKITNIKEKVQCLQLYVPKLLKLRDDSKEAFADKLDYQKRIFDIVKGLAKALCEYIKNGKKKFDTAQFNEKFKLKAHQKVRVEDLLQIFVDDLDLSKRLLQYVVEDLGVQFQKTLDESDLTQINLHHRLLEYMLYSKQ